MNMNRVRRIVSGKKARFVTDDGLELDLCYITDRIIICGLPAQGIEALYRNDRQSVRQFLSSRYGEHYRIFNFCPRFENGYDAAYFNNQVSRYPFPDHHPPPISLVPLAVRRMHDWLEADEKNVVVIHCKAGKGRSGTMCCCYLLSLPSLPLPPQVEQNISAKVRKQRKAQENAKESSNDWGASPKSSPDRSRSQSVSERDLDSDDDGANPPRSQSGGAAMDLQGTRGDSRHRAGRAKITRLVDQLASSGDEQGDTDEDGDTHTAANKEAAGMADKLQEIFDLHTAQRMKPKLTSGATARSESASNESKPTKPVRGVSIPSQRRFVGYWSRILSQQDPRPLDLLAPPNPARLERVRRSAYITEVRVYMPSKMPGLPSLFGKKHLSVHLGRYKTSFVDKIERQDLDLRELRRLEKRLWREETLDDAARARLQELQTNWVNWNDDEWDDQAKMFENEGILIEDHSSSDALPQHDGSYRRLVPQAPHIPVDADREVQFKFLIGDHGKKHAMLPDVGSLGYIWLIPSFHLKAHPDVELHDSLSYTIGMPHTEIDFFKAQSGIEKVEIDLQWSMY